MGRELPSVYGEYSGNGITYQFNVKKKKSQELA